MIDTAARVRADTGVNMRAFYLGLLALPTIALSASEEPTDLSPVIVTATRTAQTADETLAPVSVVTRADIERDQVRSVPDALRGLPGVTLDNQGGPGKQTGLRLRGTESRHVLVLIDGVRIGQATSGVTPLETLPIEQIERIEVVRGPRSSLYGSEAIGGVIQVFTRKGGGPLRPRVSAGAGTYQTVNGAIGLSGGGDRGWLDASVSFEDTEGFNALGGDGFPSSGAPVEPDRDGYRNAAGSLRAGYRFEGAEVGLHWLRSESEVEFDGAFQNESSGVQQVLGARVELRPIEPWDIKISAGRSWDELDSFLDGSFASRFDTTRDTVSLQNDILIGEHHLTTLGVDYLHDRVDSTADYEVDSRDNLGVFGQYQGDFGGHRVAASLRHDDNEQFGGHTTGDAAWGYGFTNGLRLTASYGTAFQAPSFNDLYFPGFGDPDLDPETSQSLEVGLSGGLPAGRWSVSLYQTDLRDLIAADNVGGVLRAANVNKARIRGLEAVAGARVFGWELSAALTLLDPENRSSGDNEGNLLARRPEQSFRLDLDRDFGDYNLGLSLYAAGRSFDDQANEIRLDGYAVVDLRAGYRFTDSLRLQGRLENLLDEDYATSSQPVFNPIDGSFNNQFYNQPGRGIYLTLRYEP
jgi:vitamin B12 transporter